MSSPSLKAARLQLVTRLLMGETTFRLRAAWIPPQFRDKVTPVFDETRELSSSVVDSQEPYKQKTDSSESYWIELPDNVSHSIGDGRLDHYIVDGMVRSPEKDTFDDYFQQKNGADLRQYLIAGAQILPFAGTKTQKIRKQLRLVAKALISGETRILLQKWNQYASAPQVTWSEKISLPAADTTKKNISPLTESPIENPLQENDSTGQQLINALITRSAVLTERSAIHANNASSSEAPRRQARIQAICQLPEVREAISASMLDDFKDYLDKRLQQNQHIAAPPIAEYLALHKDSTYQALTSVKSTDITIGEKNIVSLLGPDTRFSLAKPVIARERRLVTTLQRDMRAHNQFKALVWQNFDRRCAVTRKAWLGELDAAHIEDAIHGCFSVSNGLLLSPTLHRLFGRFKMSVNPASMTVHFLPDSGFEEFEGVQITPLKWALDSLKLANHWKVFLEQRGWQHAVQP